MKKQIVNADIRKLVNNIMKKQIVNADIKKALKHKKYIPPYQIKAN